MQTRRSGVLVPALVGVALAAVSALAGEGNEKADRSPTASTVSPTILPKGTSCTVRLFTVNRPAPGGQTDRVATTYQGRVASATDTALTLLVSEEQQFLHRSGAAGGLPVVGPLFSSNGIRHNKTPVGEENTVAIPVKTIQSITLVVNAGSD